MKHSCLCSWYNLSLGCALCLAIRESLIGEFAQLEYEGLYYIANGPLIPAVIYFVCRKEWARRNYLGDKNDISVKKVLTRTWENKFDWWSIFILLLASIFQAGLYISCILPFKAARTNGLNIGIITAIWSFVPFFVAIQERILYNVGIKIHHIIGMIFLVAMTILISLSDLFGNGA